MKGWDAPDRGALFVVSGPSGSGKSTLLQHVLARVPGLEFSVSATTRAPREREQDGVSYHFVGEADFSAMRAAGELIEWAVVYGCLYGTPRAPVESARGAGRSIVLDIDVQGAAQVRRAVPDAVSVFILPPSLDALRDRLRARGTDSAETIGRRMAQAEEQLQRCGDYDYLVRNEEIETSRSGIEAIFVAELLRRERRASWVAAAQAPWRRSTSA